jgi:hypothetical protein
MQECVITHPSISRPPVAQSDDTIKTVNIPAITEDGKIYHQEKTRWPRWNQPLAQTVVRPITAAIADIPFSIARYSAPNERAAIAISKDHRHVVTMEYGSQRENGLTMLEWRDLTNAAVGEFLSKDLSNYDIYNRDDGPSSLGAFKDADGKLIILGKGGLLEPRDRYFQAIRKLVNMIAITPDPGISQSATEARPTEQEPEPQPSTSFGTRSSPLPPWSSAYRPRRHSESDDSSD